MTKTITTGPRMTEAETILKMIETVEPADTAKLHEIDARVSDYLGAVKDEIYHKACCAYLLQLGLDTAGLPLYTRSRDVLKSIRPEGWHSFCVQQFGVKPSWFCSIQSPSKPAWESYTRPLPTEELAELHVVIQAIEYERSTANGTQ